MSCSHCGFACNQKGEDMPFNMFQEIMRRWAYRLDFENKWIVIGGGEPTLHPDFWKILSYAMSFGVPWVATNGSKVSDSLTLARLGARNKIRAVLSQDKWHDPIEQHVIDAFKNGLKKQFCGWWENKDFTDAREVRTVIFPYNAGRCDNGVQSCLCKSVQIRPNGDIFGCGCPESPLIGTVKDGFLEKYKDVPLFDTCYKEWKYTDGKVCMENSTKINEDLKIKLPIPKPHKKPNS